MHKILIIEDDTDLRTLYRYYLKDTYKIILEAADGWRGMELALTEQPDLIISDINLPGLNGYEVLEKLSHNPATYHIPFIFLTIEGSRASFRRGMELGADDYLAKPVNRQELLRAVASRLDRSAKLLSSYNQPGFSDLPAGLRVIHSSLYSALEQSQLEVYYQPQFKTADRSLTGVEALLRWQHPQYGTLAPASFIPQAEATGLIEPIGAWLLGQACRQVYAWQETYRLPLRLAVNLTKEQFKPSLVTLVRQTLAETAFPANLLQLELTESALVNQRSQVKKVMLELKELGVILALDDFGTGYSSLSYLKQFPFDVLKIDRAFVSQCDSTGESRAILAAITGMARALNLTTIAEGVESEAALKVLAELGCEESQGFLFAKPLSVKSFEDWMKSGLLDQGMVQSS